MAKRSINSDLIKLCELLNVDPYSVRRIVLDFQVGELPIAHIEQFTDSEKIDLESITRAVTISRGVPSG